MYVHKQMCYILYICACVCVCTHMLFIDNCFPVPEKKDTFGSLSCVGTELVL